MGDDSVHIGFVGAGSICRERHLPGLRRIDGVRVTAVCNRSESSSRRVAEAFGIESVETDWRRLVERKDVDAVFIGTWPYRHREMSVAVLEAGKHVFCQARMAMDLSEARAMVAAAESKAGLVHMICPPPTRMPFEAYIRGLVESGELGPITAINLRSQNGSNLDRDSLHWRENAAFSGRQILAMGIYAETLNAWFGPFESLSAQFGTFIKTKRDDTGAQVAVKIPQVVTIQGRLESGALVSEYHSGLVADSSDAEDWIAVHGLSGSLRYRIMSDTIEMARAGGAFEPVKMPADLVRDWQVEQDFVSAVRSARRGEPWSASPDFHEGLAYMRKVEAVHASAESASTVRLSRL